MSNMSDVINSLKNGQFINAIKNYRTMTGASLKEAKDAIDALRPHFDPTMNYMNQQPIAAEDKPKFDKWIVTAETPTVYNDWKNEYISEANAITVAKDLCKQGYSNVIISGVLAEAKPKTVWTIEL